MGSKIKRKEAHIVNNATRFHHIVEHQELVYLSGQVQFFIFVDFLFDAKLNSSIIACNRFNSIRTNKNYSFSN